MEELQARHRREQNDLQAKMTQKKKSATKKSRKRVNDECERLQRELTDRQQAERAGLDSTDNSLTRDLDDLDLNKDLHAENPGVTDEVCNTDKTILPVSEDGVFSNPRQKKPNRQKARLARRAAEQEAMVLNAEQEIADLPDLRQHERDALQERFSLLGLREIEVRPDGHCLYAAVASQLNPTLASVDQPSSDETAPFKESYQSIRNTTANFILQNADDFTPFLDEPLAEYVRKLRDTAEWGGHLELQAISKAYGVEVNVLQATGEVIKFGGDNERSHSPIWLSYYRHHFGLGEHYNALVSS